MQGFFDENVVFLASIIPKNSLKVSNFNGFIIVQQALIRPSQENTMGDLKERGTISCEIMPLLLFRIGLGYGSTSFPIELRLCPVSFYLQ
jgi:hypothetical protein